MRIGGLLKYSLIDYPEHVSAVIFTQGCNLRCPYCHNARLVDPKRFEEPLDEDMVMLFLAQRAEYLQGVVITGGEPTIHQDLKNFIVKIKALGYSVKLDTNGTNPSMLKELINVKLIDYIAMDVKASLPNYSKMTGAKIKADDIRKSIDIIIHCGLPFQFRTTLVKGWHDYKEITDIFYLIGKSPKYHLQSFYLSQNILDQRMCLLNCFSEVEIDSFQSAIQSERLVSG